MTGFERPFSPIAQPVFVFEPVDDDFAEAGDGGEQVLEMAGESRYHPRRRIHSRCPDLVAGVAPLPIPVPLLPWPGIERDQKLQVVSLLGQGGESGFHRDGRSRTLVSKRAVPARS